MKDNKMHEIGDILLVNVNSQANGKVQLSSITSNITGLNNIRTVKTEIRMTADGVFWSDWIEVPSTGAIPAQEEPLDADGAFYIQVRYERTGTETVGDLEFVDVSFTGMVEPQIFVAPTIDKSIFSDTINEPELKVLENNIFKKLYYRGILPQYIIRADNSDLKEDKDFVDLWSSVAKFFGLFIRFFKRYENFNDDYSLLYEYLKQSGLYFDETKVTLEDLQYLTRHFYDQIRQRGTNMIFKKKGDVLADGTIVPIDGEFIRLMRTRIYDELLYEVIPLEKMGWCVGQSSPMWRGTSRSENLNKTKEKTSDFEDLSNFVINKIGTASYSLAALGDKKVLRLNAAGSNSKVGLGRINDTQDVSENLYVVDSRMDYEICFAFYIQSGLSDTTKILFGVEGFDSSKNKLTDAFITPNAAGVSETFFETTTVRKVANCWYFARGIIHAYNTINTDEIKTNLGIGTNLHFNNPFVRYILPKIQLSSDNGAMVSIWDYKIRPLVRGTNILPLKSGALANATSLGFIQSSRIFYIYVKTNNNSLSQREITEIVNKYLLSFNFNTIFVYISNF